MSSNEIIECLTDSNTAILRDSNKILEISVAQADRFLSLPQEEKNNIYDAIRAQLDTTGNTIN